MSQTLPAAEPAGTGLTDGVVRLHLDPSEPPLTSRSRISPPCRVTVTATGGPIGWIELTDSGDGLAQVSFGRLPRVAGDVTGVDRPADPLLTRALRLVVARLFAPDDPANPDPPNLNPPNPNPGSTASPGPGSTGAAGNCLTNPPGRVEVLHWRAETGDWAGRRIAWSVGFRVLPPVPALLVRSGRRVDGWIGTLRRGEALEPAHSWLVPEVLHGTGVSLRELREIDVPRIVDGSRDRRTAYWFGHREGDYAEAEAREHLNQARLEQAAGRAVFWALSDPGDQRLLGELRVTLTGREQHRGEIGYWTHPGERDRGVMTEAIRLASRHALLPAEDGGLGLDSLLVRAAAGNGASQRVAEKAGFTRAGLDRAGDLLGDGTIVDVVRFDLLPDELPAVR